MIFDLHAHSYFSDGTLSPTALITRAKARGVDVMALTDHDELSGLAEAQHTADALDVKFCPGVEVSVSYADLTLHIVGLQIDAKNATLSNGLSKVRQGRDARGKLMADDLALSGITGAYEGALTYAANPALLSRTHFARYLVEHNYVSDTKEAFKRYLTVGKPGYVPHQWAKLQEGIDWIHAAGGRAVLAHPGRYPVQSSNELQLLLEAFKEAGGDAIEVYSSSHSPAQFAEFASYARHYGFMASCGSDFHSPTESLVDLGDLPPLPASLTPVWHDWY
jgi:3',5'-nucleoside bisphosphate phosphatase